MERLLEYDSITCLAPASLERNDGSEIEVPGRRWRRASSVTGIVDSLVAAVNVRGTAADGLDTYNDGDE